MLCPQAISGSEVNVTEKIEVGFASEIPGLLTYRALSVSPRRGENAGGVSTGEGGGCLGHCILLYRSTLCRGFLCIST